MTRVATVYGLPFDLSSPTSMSQIRWLRVSACLARLGHAAEVDKRSRLRLRAVSDMVYGADVLLDFVREALEPEGGDG